MNVGVTSRSWGEKTQRLFWGTKVSKKARGEIARGERSRPSKNRGKKKKSCDFKSRGIAKLWGGKEDLGSLLPLTREETGNTHKPRKESRARMGETTNG